jgi:hypothetical protein
MANLVITPKTKIYELLEAYPELENILISAAPAFSKLKNPVLRKTIARVTNIGQAASIAGLKVEDLVNRLRGETGQYETGQAGEAETNYFNSRPAWFVAENITKTIDISEMLNRDEQPVHEVLSSIRDLEENKILEVKAPFLPAPLIDKSLGLGYRHWVDRKSAVEYIVYFVK